jgi:hypothetical protein
MWCVGVDVARADATQEIFVALWPAVLPVFLGLFRHFGTRRFMTSRGETPTVMTAPGVSG